MPSKPKKIDLMSAPKKQITASRVLYIFLIVLGAIIVVGALVFAFEWNSLKNENNKLTSQLNLANSTLAEVNEAGSATNVSNTETNTTTTNTTNTSDATPTSGLVSKVKIYLVAVGDNGKSGELIGCGDSLVAVSKDVTPTTKPLEAAIKELLSIKTHDYGESGLTDALYQSTLQVKEVSLQDKKATIKLTGTVLSGGVCDDPRIVSQLQTTALQFSTVKEVEISVNDVPLDQLF